MSSHSSLVKQSFVATSSAQWQTFDFQCNYMDIGGLLPPAPSSLMWSVTFSEWSLAQFCSLLHHKNLSRNGLTLHNQIHNHHETIALLSYKIEVVVAQLYCWHDINITEMKLPFYAFQTSFPANSLLSACFVEGSLQFSPQKGNLSIWSQAPIQHFFMCRLFGWGYKDVVWNEDLDKDWDQAILLSVSYLNM